MNAVHGPQEATWDDVFELQDQAAELGECPEARTLRDQAYAMIPAACASYRLAESGTRALSELDKAGMSPQWIEFMDRPGFADATAANREAGQ